MINLYNDRGSIHKKAFEFNINPASVIGAIVGTMTARETAKRQATAEIKNALTRSAEPANFNYYKQVDTFANNLTVRFTPLGILYIVRDGLSDLTVDQIGLNEMTPEVRVRFDVRDEAFFKNIMLNKIRSDINLTENILAKRLIERKMDIGFGKQATNDRHHLEMIKTASEFMPNSETLDFILEGESITVTAELTDKASLFKYANIFGGPLEFLNFGEDKERLTEKTKLEDPQYIINNTKMMFLPDRVMFTVDGKVLGQLSVLDMNEEGYIAFGKENSRYFLNFFGDKLGVKRSPIVDILKYASEARPVSELFKESFVHPELYYQILNKQYGVAWLGYDPEILIKAIETDFTGGEAIDFLCLNKLNTIQAANNPSAILFKNIFGFEKMVRALNGKPIDFSTIEDEISLGEFVFALRTAENVTPFDDIYDNFSIGVMDYMENALTEQNYLLIDIEPFKEDERLLFKHLDLEVRSNIFEYKYGGESDIVRNKELARIGLITKTASSILKEIRSGQNLSRANEIIESTIARVIKSLTAMGDDYAREFSDMVRLCVDQNISVDAYLKFMSDQLKINLNE